MRQRLPQRASVLGQHVRHPMRRWQHLVRHFLRQPPVRSEQLRYLRQRLSEWASLLGGELRSLVRRRYQVVRHCLRRHHERSRELRRMRDGLRRRDDMYFRRLYLIGAQPVES